MGLTRQDKDFQSFTEVNGQQARRVTNVGMGNLLEGVVYDYISAAYPTNTTEVYTYREGGASGTIQATITVTYQSASKNQITSVERS